MTPSLRGPLADFALAWRLLTAIPAPFLPADPERPPGRAAAYYPLVGLGLGLLLAGAGWLLYLALPPGLAAALLLAVWAGLTGLLHLDGFMDTCDGLLPPRDRDRRLEIMKDSRVGAFGVVGGVLLLLVKYNALAALPAGARLPALVLSPILARWAVVWVMARYPLARREGVSVFFKAGLGRAQVATASLAAALAVIILAGWPGLLLLAAAWAAATLLALMAVARLGGLTGDIYGAICEVVETVLLIAVIVIANSGLGAYFLLVQMNH